ncbi:MAG: hypothetical protein AB7O96_02780 [Pseudobdellovibrionaceae bacterium]
MVLIRDFVDFLNSSSLERTHCLKALENWSRFCCPTDQKLNEALSQFVRAALTFPLWQNNRKQFGLELAGVVEIFADSARIDVAQLRFDDPLSMEVFTATSVQTLNSMAESFLKSKALPGDLTRVLPTQDGYPLALLKRSTGPLFVYILTPYFYVNPQGLIQPLREDFVMSYSADLTLAEKEWQKIPLRPGAEATFQLMLGHYSGIYCDGATFEKVEEFTQKSPENVGPLLFEIKKREKYFIDRHTDPLYRQTLSALERLQNYFESGHPQASEKAGRVLAQAQLIFEKVYSDDQVLSLHIKNILAQMKATRGAIAKGSRLADPRTLNDPGLQVILE